MLYSVKGEIVKTEQMNYMHCSIKIMILALSLVVLSHIGQEKIMSNDFFNSFD